MRVRLPPSAVEKLTAALKRAGDKEIGGQLFGEQIAPSNFTVTELTVQARRGTIARFVVDLVQAAKDAVWFFDRTAHKYTRFNYIGEWHSHPSYAVQPSGTDLATMRALVRDPAFRGSFAVLIIVRLDPGGVTSGGRFFDPQGHESSFQVETDLERQE